MNYLRERAVEGDSISAGSHLFQVFHFDSDLFSTAHKKIILLPYSFCNNFEKSFTVKINIIQKLEKIKLSLKKFK